MSVVTGFLRYNSWVDVPVAIFFSSDGLEIKGAGLLHGRISNQVFTVGNRPTGGILPVRFQASLVSKKFIA